MEPDVDRRDDQCQAQFFHGCNLCKILTAGGEANLFVTEVGAASAMLLAFMPCHK